MRAKSGTSFERAINVTIAIALPNQSAHMPRKLYPTTAEERGCRKNIHNKSPVKNPHKGKNPPLCRIAPDPIPSQDQIGAKVRPGDQRGEEEENQGGDVEEDLQGEDLGGNFEGLDVGQGARSGRTASSWHGSEVWFVCFCT